MPSDQHQGHSPLPPPSLFWFWLLDSESRQPYMGVTVDAVSLHPDSVVVQFRDAVQAKYDKPNYLKDIPSDGLLVLKN